MEKTSQESSENAEWLPATRSKVNDRAAPLGFELRARQQILQRRNHAPLLESISTLQRPNKFRQNDGRDANRRRACISEQFRYSPCLFRVIANEQPEQHVGIECNHPGRLLSRRCFHCWNSRHSFHSRLILSCFSARWSPTASFISWRLAACPPGHRYASSMPASSTMLLFLATMRTARSVFST